jgi:pyridoxal phosphate enzyme (YggS family)
VGGGFKVKVNQTWELAIEVGYRILVTDYLDDVSKTYVNLKLLEEINKQAARFNRTIQCLLQVHIAEEETKFGLSEKELEQLLEQYSKQTLPNIEIAGLMGMATNTDNVEQIRKEFHHLKTLQQSLKARFFADKDTFKELSVGMSGDYTIALEEGSTMVRIGSMLFGSRV